MKVYLSGQISNLSEEEYTDNFTRAARLFPTDEVINPLKVTPCSDRRCGGGQTLSSGAQLHAYSCYMKYDIKAMLECDVIAMLPNWMLSSGAGFEMQVAIKCGLDVVYITQDYEKVMM